MSVLDELDAGELRAARPDPEAPSGWRVEPAVKEAILELFRDRGARSWTPEETFTFVDRAALPPRRAPVDGGRIVPGGTSVRAGVYLGPGTTIMPPSYVNVGAWIGAGTMIDSHVLVGSCAQVGAGVHVSAGAQLGGVLEPPNARPVIVEDEAFIGAGCGLFDGVLVRHRAVLAAGVMLTGTSRLYDCVEDRVLSGTLDTPLEVPPEAVVVPGTRRLDGAFARAHRLSVATALIVKRREAGTDSRTALESALR
jgi:2,3,4,5-tetrahydropyridine-2,6-dicarboxylate N-succinyltransferase